MYEITIDEYRMLLTFLALYRRRRWAFNKERWN